MAYIEKSDLSMLGYDLSTIEDSDIDKICDTASDIVDEYIGQSLILKTTIERVIPTRTGCDFKIFTANTPIISVDHIRLYQNTSIYQNLSIDNYVINPDSNINYIQVYHGIYFIFCEIKYTHGYAVVPASIKSGTILIAQELIDNYMSCKSTGFSDSIGLKEFDIQITRKYKEAKNILKKYKKV